MEEEQAKTKEKPKKKKKKDLIKELTNNRSDDTPG